MTKKQHSIQDEIPIRHSLNAGRKGPPRKAVSRIKPSPTQTSPRASVTVVCVREGVSGGVKVDSVDELGVTVTVVVYGTLHRKVWYDCAWCFLAVG
eukprot:gene4337-biopygen12542